jgi:hypothetical protein
VSSSEPGPAIPRIRKEPLPDTGVLVLRGRDPQDPGLDAMQAGDFRERYPDWDRYGLSGFVATTEAEVDALAQGRLLRFPLLAVFDRGVLERAGFEVVPTFRSPHVTIAFTGDLAVRLDDLWALEHDEWANPYHGGTEPEELNR